MACEISTTLTPLAASVPNTRPATPGTPTMPGPRSVSNARSPTDVIPFASFPSYFALREMSVPGASGLNVFLMRIGMRLATAGSLRVRERFGFQATIDRLADLLGGVVTDETACASASTHR